MELTDRHLEMIRETVRQVDYGSVTINISANSNKLDLSIQKRIRYDDEQGDFTTDAELKEGRRGVKKA
jgi:hypothetical protein